MSWLKGWLTGGADELGWDDLVDKLARALAERRHFGQRGEVVFPAEVQVTVMAPERGLDVIRGFLDKPELARRVAAELANRCDCDASALPLCTYVAQQGDRLDIQVEDRRATARWQITVDGGDRSGAVLELPATKREIRFGRGQWHGAAGQLRNDLVVCEKSEFVSRRAGRLLRVGHALEVEALDQGDFLIVHSEAGDSVRPARSASGRIAVRSGDDIELSSGTGDSVRLALRRTQE